MDTISGAPGTLRAHKTDPAFYSPETPFPVRDWQETKNSGAFS
jgi:hypothetical protein